MYSSSLYNVECHYFEYCYIESHVFIAVSSVAIRVVSVSVSEGLHDTKHTNVQKNNEYNYMLSIKTLSIM
jgi:hypothetical protein